MERIGVDFLDLPVSIGGQFMKKRSKFDRFTADGSDYRKKIGFKLEIS